MAFQPGMFGGPCGWGTGMDGFAEMVMENGVPVFSRTGPGAGRPAGNHKGGKSRCSANNRSSASSARNGGHEGMNFNPFVHLLGNGVPAFAGAVPIFTPQNWQTTCGSRQAGNNGGKEENAGSRKPTSDSDAKNSANEGATPVPNPFTDLIKGILEQVQKSAADHQKKFQWSQTVNLRGFQPDEITVKVNDQKLDIHAVHEDGDENGFDRREATRHLEIPASIDPESIRVWRQPNGSLAIVGSSKQEAKPTSPTEKETATEENTGESGQPSFGSEEQKSDKSGSTAEFPANQSDPEAGEKLDVDPEHGGSMEKDDTPADEDSQMTFMEEDEDTGDGSGSEESFVIPVDKEFEELGPFSVNINVSVFPPETIKVKVAGCMVTVSALHEEEADGVTSQKKMDRSYILPDHVDSNALKCTLSKDGILLLEAPVLKPEETSEKDIEIQLADATKDNAGHTSIKDFIISKD